jgi:hypothetical protein
MITSAISSAAAIACESFPLAGWAPESGYGRADPAAGWQGA